MPWTKDNLPDSAKNLTLEQIAIFLEVANKLLAEGVDEGEAIAKALAAAKGETVSECEISEDIKLDREPSGFVWDATILAAGWSKNGWYHKREKLAELAALCEGVPIYRNHIPAGQPVSPERDILEKLGWVEKTRVEGMKVKGKVHLVENEFGRAIAESALSAFKRGKDGFVGLSIQTDRRAQIREGEAEGRRGKIVESYGRILSVDLVNAQSAGGALNVPLAEAERKEETMKKISEMTLADLREIGMSDEQIGMVRPDLFKAEGAKAAPDAEKPAEKAEVKKDEPKADVKPAETKAPEAPAPSLSEAVREALAVEKAIDGCKLPEISKARIRKAAEGKAIAEVNHMIEDESKFVAELTGAGKEATIREGFSGATQPGNSNTWKLIRDFFNPGKAAPCGNREFWRRIGVTDENGNICVRPRNPQMKALQECVRHDLAAEMKKTMDAGKFTSLRESEYETALSEVTRGDTGWTTLVGHIINLIGMEFQGANAQIAKYRKDIQALVPVPERLENWDSQDIWLPGGFNRLSTVLEDGIYTAATGGTPIEATYSPTKRGNFISLTKELLASDAKVGLVRSYPLALQLSYWSTLHYWLFYTLTFLNTDTLTSTSRVLFNSTDGTLAGGGSLLTLENLAIGIQAMMNQQFNGPTTSYEIELLPKIIAVGPANMQWVMETLFSDSKKTSTEDSTQINFLKNIGLDTFLVLPDAIGASGSRAAATSWAIFADQSAFKSLSVGFVGGNMEPRVYTADGEATFDQLYYDRMIIRIDNSWGGKWLDYRGVYGYLGA